MIWGFANVTISTNLARDLGTRIVAGKIQAFYLICSVTDHLPVFSAPKYCDSTENKGAYINIGPDYKLDFHKFDAVPHPDIKPMAYAAQSGLMGMT